MTPPSRPRARLLGVVLAAVSLLGLAPGAGAARTPVQDGTASEQPVQPSMTLVARSPWVGAEGVVEVDVTVADAPEGAGVRLRVHEAIDSMEELEEALDDDGGRVLHRSPAVPLGFLPQQPDGSRRLQVAVSATRADEGTVRISDPGVHMVSITLEDPDGSALRTIRTPVVRLGTDDEPLAAPDLALVLDVAAEPSIEVDGRRDLGDDELDRLDRLAAVLDGRQLPGAGGPLDATIAPSPDTIDALTASADPRAASVLDALAMTDGDRTVIGAPYVPLDASALTAAGLGDFVEPVLDAGRAVLTDRIGAELDTTTWEVAGGIDAPGATTLGGLGLRHLLVDVAEEAIGTSPATERRLVDAGPVEVPGIRPLEAVLVDTATSSALTARAVDRADAGHIALAELVVRDAGEDTTVVIRTDDVPDDSVLVELLPLLVDPSSPVTVGPLEPGTLDDAEVGDDGDDDPAAPGAVLPPPDPTGGEAGALAEVADDVRDLAGAVDTFAGLVGPESARADGLRLQIATSLARGIDAERRIGLLAAVRATVEGGFDAVVLTGQTDLNLTARSGTLPIMILNRNQFPVRVVLRIRSDRLTFREGDRFEFVVSEEVTRFDVPVDARATGSVPTFVEILTPDERVVLDSRRLDVRSTAVSGVGLLLSAGALAVLVFWWARTWRRSRRAGRRMRDRPGT